MIGIAAVRYFLIKFSRGKIIAFDLDEALSFEGESGPYIQYAVVRANNIFQKVQQRDRLDEPALLASLRDVSAAELTGENGSHELWSLVLDASRLDEIVEQVVKTLEFSVLAKYAFSLAQAFNAFYHRSQILNEERDDVRRWRAGAVIYLRNQLTRALDLMGIAVPPTNVMAIIAIARCSKLPDYEESIRRAGGEPWVVEVGTNLPADVVRRASGILLAGGGDVNPALFGETPHPTFDAAESGRDDYEIELIRLATRARPSAAGDLPRHPGAQCRARRHAGAGHSLRTARRDRAHAGRAAAQRVRPRARGLDREGLAAVTPRRRQPEVAAIRWT